MRKKKSPTTYVYVNKAWFDEEDNIIRAKAGYYSLADITREINGIRAHYHLNARTKSAVGRRASIIGCSLLATHVYANAKLAHLLGVSTKTVKAWQNEGLLPGHAWGPYWVFEEQEVIGFITKYPWMLTLEHIRLSKFRNILDVHTRRDPWLNATEVSKILGASKSTIYKYIYLGLITSRRGVSAPYPTHMIQASQIPYIREVLIEMAKRKPKVQSLVLAA